LTAIEGIQARRLNLTLEPMTEENGNRPQIRLWAETNEQGQRIVAMSIGALFGQPLRFIDLTTNEAHTLGTLLRQVTRDIAALP